jgi:hypothetical protein
MALELCELPATAPLDAVVGAAAFDAEPVDFVVPQPATASAATAAAAATSVVAGCRRDRHKLCLLIRDSLLVVVPGGPGRRARGGIAQVAYIALFIVNQ